MIESQPLDAARPAHLDDVDDSVDTDDFDHDDAHDAHDDLSLEPPSYQFNVEVGGEQVTFEERADAVAFAKSATEANERTAFLVRSDERLRMQFREGSLFDYVLETRKGRNV